MFTNGRSKRSIEKGTRRYCQQLLLKYFRHGSATFAKCHPAISPSRHGDPVVGSQKYQVKLATARMKLVATAGTQQSSVRLQIARESGGTVEMMAPSAAPIAQYGVMREEQGDHYY
jgi:hypothetical protein